METAPLKVTLIGSFVRVNVPVRCIQTQIGTTFSQAALRAGEGAVSSINYTLMSTFRCGSLCLPKRCRVMHAISCNIPSYVPRYTQLHFNKLQKFMFKKKKNHHILFFFAFWQDITVLLCFRGHNTHSCLQQSQELQFNVHRKFFLPQTLAGNWRCRPPDLK